MNDVSWFYEQAGQQAGPTTQAELGEAIRAGRLAPGARVWRAGMTGWLPWESVPELAAHAAPPSLPASSPPPPTAYGAPPSYAPPPAWGQPGQPGQPVGGTAPFPPNSYAADVLAAGAPGALYPKAPLGARFVAALLDNLVSTVPAAVLVAVAVGAAAGDASGLAAIFGLAAAAAVIWAIWYSFTKDGRANGQSIGKKAMGLMVVHLPTNGPCSRGQSAIRYLVLLAFNLVPYVGWLVEPIVTLSADGGRRLGDKAAGTQVIAVTAHRR